MLRIGIIGGSPGNGHPYSYSSIINGFNSVALERECPYGLIKDYLPKDSLVYGRLEGIQVTSIYCPDHKLAASIARVANIPLVCKSLDELINGVDAVILARDDPETRPEFIPKIIKSKKPVFIDKLISKNFSDLRWIQENIPKHYPLMCGSAVRYSSSNILPTAFVENLDQFEISGSGVCRSTWELYGHHLIEMITPHFGFDFETVQCLSCSKNIDIFIIKMRNGIYFTLHFGIDFKLPIKLEYYSSSGARCEIRFENYYECFLNMLTNFRDLVNGKIQTPVSRDEIITTAALIHAGTQSKLEGGKLLYVRELFLRSGLSEVV